MGHFHEVVAAHHRDSEAVLVAAREPCLSIAVAERSRVRGRSFRIIAPSRLQALEVRASWIMAVLLCPGDDAGAVAAWVTAGGHDARRVLFYLHPATDPRSALRPWVDAGLRVHAMRMVSRWEALHKHFGAAWNVQVFDDFREAQGGR